MTKDFSFSMFYKCHLDEVRGVNLPSLREMNDKYACILKKMSEVNQIDSFKGRFESVESLYNELLLEINYSQSMKSMSNNRVNA